LQDSPSARIAALAASVSLSVATAVPLLLFNRWWLRLVNAATSFWVTARIAVLGPCSVQPARNPDG